MELLIITLIDFLLKNILMHLLLNYLIIMLEFNCIQVNLALKGENSERARNIIF
jgi:hypothetical protein